MNSNYDVVIIGSGPAGYTAALYAARNKMSVLMLSGFQPGGQLTITTDVENYPGFAEVIQGPWLMQQMQVQVKRFGVEILDQNATTLSKSGDNFTTIYGKDKTIESRTVIIATGAQAKWLGLESEKEFLGYGVSGCATCDAMFYRNKIVCVIGGGNVAVEEAIHLAKYASKVYLIHRRDSLRAEKMLQDRLFANEKIEMLWNRELKEVIGETDPMKFVTGVKIHNRQTNQEENITLDGVFIAIGHEPNTKIFRDFLKCDEHGYIEIQPGSTITSVPGVFACGDVQDKVYKQAITAAGSGCMAALDAQRFLDNA